MIISTEDIKWPRVTFDDIEPRQPGLHLGDVIRSLSETLGTNPGRKGGGGFQDMKLTAEIGLLWEDMLSLIMGQRYAMRPSQMVRDGIWMSPDGIGYDPDGQYPMAVEEYKATWQSTRRCPSENWRYMTQVKSYCRAVGTPCAIMRIFYIMGDYKGSGPIYRVSRIVFDPRELEDNWRMIVRHAEGMK